MGQTSAECDGRGERGSGDWVEEEHLHEGGGRPSSFFGVSSSPGPESTYEDSQARREEDSPGPETERRSSFYGLEEQFPPSSSTPDCRSPSLPNGLRNFQANNDSSSNSSLSHEAPRGGVRYQTAPYAASRAASVHGMPSNDPAPAPLLDQSHLRPGVLASLLTHDKTLDLYRANAKKTNDPDIQFEFCTFVMEIVGEMEGDGGVLERGTAEQQADSKAKQQALIAESVALLSKLANRGHVKSQYFLADCYTQGVGTTKVRSELLLVGGEELTVRWSRDDEITTRRFRSSFWRASTVTRTPASVPLNAVSMGGGARRTSPKPSSSSGARTRSPHDDSPADLALVGEPPFSLILERCIDSVSQRSTASWDFRSVPGKESSGSSAPPSSRTRSTLHNLRVFTSWQSCTRRESTTSSSSCAFCLLLWRVLATDVDLTQDEEYAAELLARASELQYAPSAFKLGECYEYGRMGCPQDSALSIHYYSTPPFACFVH